MKSFTMLVFPLLTLLSLCHGAALPVLSADGPQAVVLGSQPTSVNSKWEVLRRLMMRQSGFTCTFNSNTGCNNDWYCCWKDTQDPEGFCCLGPCCGDNCCTTGQYCYFDAAQNSAYSCCPTGSTCTVAPATVIQTVFDSVFMTVTGAGQTVEVTQAVTEQQTVQQTVVETGPTETKIQTQIQTLSQSFTVVQTVNAAGQTVQHTNTILLSASMATNTAISSPIASGTVVSNTASTGDIVGGVVGGFAALALLGLLIFIGMRKGWFSPRQERVADEPPGILSDPPNHLGHRPY